MVAETLSLGKFEGLNEFFPSIPNQAAFHKQVAGVRAACGFAATFTVAMVKTLSLTDGSVMYRAAKTTSC